MTGPVTIVTCTSTLHLSVLCPVLPGSMHRPSSREVNQSIWATDTLSSSSSSSLLSYSLLPLPALSVRLYTVGVEVQQKANEVAKETVSSLRLIDLLPVRDISSYVKNIVINILQEKWQNTPFTNKDKSKIIQKLGPHCLKRREILLSQLRTGLTHIF